MQMNRRNNPKMLSAITAIMLLLAISPQADATFHLWDINEVFSNADGTVWFIELILPPGTIGCASEHLLSGKTFTTNGDSFTFLSNLPSSDTCDKFFLIASSSFSSLAGAVTPDYVVSKTNFFSISGDTLNFAATSDILTFGSGVLPTDGVLSLDGNLSTGTNSPKNFAGDTGSIDLSNDPNNIQVDFSNSGFETGSSTYPFNTMGEAISEVADNGTITIDAGTDADTSETPAIGSDGKAMIITAVNGTAEIGRTAGKTGGFIKWLRTLSEMSSEAEDYAESEGEI